MECDSIHSVIEHAQKYLSISVQEWFMSDKLQEEETHTSVNTYVFQIYMIHMIYIIYMT